jgi:hypothetical protein
MLYSETLYDETQLRECSLFIPGVGTEDKLIEMRKKQPPTRFDQPFFPLPNYCMTWIFISPNSISKLYMQVFYIYIIIQARPCTIV